MKKYDYIILGGGAAGLSLAFLMSKDAYFLDKKILLLEKENKNTNDRTWCYWEDEKGDWDDILTKRWNIIRFAGPSIDKEFNLEPYTYKCLRSADFYTKVYRQIEKTTSVEIRREKVVSFRDHGQRVQIKTVSAHYEASKVFSSISFQTTYKKQQRYPLLNQHFVGWFIEIDKPVFKDYLATFMDFNVAQKGNTRFMYMLPLSQTKALFEYTLFSKKMLKNEEYESEIKAYLNKIGIKNYKITEKERGCIPMTSYNFAKHNSKNLLYIGTVGGWTKASTGFTFKSTVEKNKSLISFIKNEGFNLIKFNRRTRFWVYDLLFLDVLYQRNERGAELFSKLFRKNKTETILKFLEEKTSFIEELRIMISMPSLLFTKALFKRIFKIPF